MPDGFVPLVSLAKAARTEPVYDDEPEEFATWQTGLEWRPCLADCNHLTQNADGWCDYHDVFGEPTKGWLSC